MTTAHVPGPPAELHSHDVRFYESSASLARTLAAFAEAAIARNEPLLLIVTPEHRRATLTELHARGCDVESRIDSRRLVIQDAQSLLKLISQRSAEQQAVLLQAAYTAKPTTGARSPA